MKISRLFVAVVLFTVLSQAEDKYPAKVVRVVGTSEVKVVPDRAVIAIGVEKQDPRASVAKHAADSAARLILNALRKNEIDEKDVQTTFLSLQPQSAVVKKVRIHYFVGSQTLTVTVRDLAKLERVLESVVNAGGNRIDSIQYETSDLRKYRDQARELAMKAAREKAQALAHALGQEIGKAQMIEEQLESSYPLQNGFFYNASLEAGARNREPGPSLAAGQTSVSASVIVAFDLI